MDPDVFFNYVGKVVYNNFFFTILHNLIFRILIFTMKKSFNYVNFKQSYINS